MEEEGAPEFQVVKHAQRQGDGSGQGGGDEGREFSEHAAMVPRTGATGHKEPVGLMIAIVM